MSVLKRMNYGENAREAVEVVDPAVKRSSEKIVDFVRREGNRALRECIEKFEQRTPDRLLLNRDDMSVAFERLPCDVKGLLERTHSRIERFAVAQLSSVKALRLEIPGGAVGHQLAPLETAGCYAPGGRFPLPSSVLMTVTTARVAGVSNVVLATPNCSDIMLGAAYLAGADQVLWAGGAHAVAALAYGTETVPKVDIIVGPGNAWVTAAKAIVSDTVSIDMLAGPSELVVLADGTADADIIAADLLAQAEHDPDARPILVTNSVDLADAVDVALDRQVRALSTAEIAQQALQNGQSIVCRNESELIAAVDQLAPEHLEVMGKTVEPLARRLKHYGALFLGSAAAEVIGDYGAGPNHVLQRVAPLGKQVD